MVRGSIFTNFTDMAFNFTYFFEEFLVRENNENFFRTLFLRTFFFAPLVSKKKVAKEFCLFQGGSSRAPTPTINAPVVSKKKVANSFT